jgi:hypothetical protein
MAKRKYEMMTDVILGWAVAVFGSMIALFMVGFTFSMLWTAFMFGWNLL